MEGMYSPCLAYRWPTGEQSMALQSQQQIPADTALSPSETHN